MQKNTKRALIFLLILILVAVPLYIYTHPDNSQLNSLQVKGDVHNPITLTFAELESYPSKTIQVSLTSSSRTEDNGVFNYTGVCLKDLLNQAQANINGISVFVQAQDGYGATITMEEAQNQNTLIAYKKDDTPLTLLKDGGEGPLRLIIGDDLYAQRWVRGISAIQVN